MFLPLEFHSNVSEITASLTRTHRGFKLYLAYQTGQGAKNSGKSYPRLLSHFNSVRHFLWCDLFLVLYDTFFQRFLKIHKVYGYGKFGDCPLLPTCCISSKYGMSSYRFYEEILVTNTSGPVCYMQLKCEKHTNSSALKCLIYIFIHLQFEC